MVVMKLTWALLLFFQPFVKGQCGSHSNGPFFATKSSYPNLTSTLPGQGKQVSTFSIRAPAEFETFFMNLLIACCPAEYQQDNCSPQALWWLFRHGTRYPGRSTISWMKVRGLQIRDAITDAHSEGRGK